VTVASLICYVAVTEMTAEVDIREVDPRLLDRARRTIERHGWQGATLQRLAEESGVSRMTLHRRGVSRELLLRALGEQLEREYREALWPALTAPGSALERLELALTSLCKVVDGNLELLDALGHAERDVVFHEPRKPALTKQVFTEPVRRLLADGAADGSLAVDDPEETATVLFNLVGHTYRHLRSGHGWSAKRTREAVLGLALRGVVAR
jgi:AcrR family transcriptional regulator